MSYSKKIASAAVQNRTQTPFWNWLRNKLLAVDRQPVTPPPGVATPDGKAKYHNPLRFPNTQTARTTEPPNLPLGVHHQLAENYYKDRDARRDVLPPAPLYVSDASGTKFGNPHGEVVEVADAVKKGPDANFGLETPTPGFGMEWNRSRSHELDSQKNDPQLSYLEKFDRFARA